MTKKAKEQKLILHDKGRDLARHCSELFENNRALWMALKEPAREPVGRDALSLARKFVAMQHDEIIKLGETIGLCPITMDHMNGWRGE
jgi:hypothetical protein|tara:strand:+ start:702 stop:965 length:264 start_codon:yes stop_codon:yes gene_type:complete